MAEDGNPGGRGDGAEWAGTPQGSPISPLLANIALHVLDEAWQREGPRLGMLVRYCDDFVVLSPTRQRAEQARELAPSARAMRVLRDKVRAATACSRCTPIGSVGRSAVARLAA
ncbi:reverse transcriptase domain-containing protein [Actinocrispum wychmicini]|uniref:reverse transcriptase domain-containing protein n=1 Tax=Actinocrispum wychmicini TaxID=1213861 RepID=UPI0014042E77|nr:reverse transcriptase domain-containing protein [Actinocrispum wychmicini]